MKDAEIVPQKVEKPAGNDQRAILKAEGKPKSRPKVEAKSASNRNNAVSGVTSNLGSTLATLIVPKSMFDIFGDLPVEIAHDQVSEKSVKVEDETKAAYAKVEESAPMIEAQVQPNQPKIKEPSPKKPSPVKSTD